MEEKPDHLLIVKIPREINTKVANFAKKLGVTKRYVVGKALSFYMFAVENAQGEPTQKDIDDNIKFNIPNF